MLFWNNSTFPGEISIDGIEKVIEDHKVSPTTVYMGWIFCTVSTKKWGVLLFYSFDVYIPRVMFHDLHIIGLLVGESNGVNCVGIGVGEK